MSKIFRKTLVAVVLVFGVTANATALLSAWLLHRHLTDEYVSKGRAVAVAVASASRNALVGEDTASLEAIIAGMPHIADVGYVFVTDRTGRVLAHTFDSDMPAAVPRTSTGPRGDGGADEVNLPGRGRFLQVMIPIRSDVGGQVGVGMDMAGIWRSMRGAVLRQEGLMFLMLAVAVGVFYVLVGSVTRPLVELAGYAVRIRDHDFSAVPPETGNDEVGILARAMRSMAGELSLLVSDLTRAVADTTRELQDTLAHTRAIIDNLADGLLVVDPSGRASRFNPALLALFALDAASVTGRPAAVVFPELMAGLAGMDCQEGEPASTEVRLPGGGTGKALATPVRLGEIGGTREATVILVRDITREKEVDRMKTEFISTVSHELRTPLTSVLGFAKILRRKFQEDIVPVLPGDNPRIERGAAQIRDNLEIIVTEGERLTELVDDVLDIAKMESGRYEWNMAPVSLAGVVEHAARTIAPLASRKGLALTTELPPDLPDILGDRDRLIQVCLNLLGNAVKFTESGGVTLEAEERADHIRMTVRDTGCGIGEEDLERVFEKFRQAGDTLTEKPKGTGLGLPICRQIVEHHGGRIWAESRPGEGSAFIFTLPRASGEEFLAVPSCPLPADAGMIPLDTDNRKRILVVDDDTSVRRFLETIFTDAGYAVALAGNGAEALRLAASWRPACITMDLRMPGMGGEEAIRALRAAPQTRNIPVVVVSVLSDREPEATGADAAVVKPVDQEALIATVRGLLSGQAAHARPCLIYSPDGSRLVSRQFIMCPGQARECGDEEELWRHIEDGFRGTVFVPASRGHDLDLKRLSAVPDLHVIIMPD
jgi:PAS domain S-box-containing protein